MKCPKCQKHVANAHGLKIHDGVAHQDQPERAAPKVPAALAAAEPLGEHRREYPPESDRNNAEILVRLPWITWPATVEQCDDVLNGIAIGLERTSISNAFWCSLRAYITEFRKRLLTQKTAA